MKITIFGLAGTGTSTLGKALAKELNLKFYSTGDIMREKAKKRNMSIYEFDELVKNNPKIDLELDKTVAEIGKSQDDFIFESRLAWNFIPDSTKIYLNCDDNTRFKRIATREELSSKDSKKLTIKRAQVVKERYNNIYPDILFPPKEEKFDLVLDSGKHNVKELINQIIDYLIKKGLLK